MEDIIKMADDADVYAFCRRWVKLLGFDYFAGGTRNPLPIFNPSISMFSNYPVDWQTTYQDNDYVSIDPVVRRCREFISPQAWSCREFTERPFAEQALAHGIGHGVSLCMRDGRGYQSVITFARQQEPCMAIELLELQGMLAMFGQLTHAQLVRQSQCPDLASLTSRELEVLKWTAEGKTSAEIAQIMDIKVRTVNFHVDNCVLKLSASNKLHAVVKASRVGIL
ncbi:autoinducer binding domain-containing protein [Pseudomonas sp. NPDC089547]|uniref:autoinducer binding domain-containing protein n=1 Tax=Pseudomonas sp. NPDC089547 TaxID=3390652 RepID=UPI003D024A4E